MFDGYEDAFDVHVKFFIQICKFFQELVKVVKITKITKVIIKEKKLQIFLLHANGICCVG